jgi:desulfoferrodoxin-like iron-binding protein
MFAICGNKVQVLETRGGTLVCCGKGMTLIARASQRLAQEDEQKKSG